MKFSPIVVAGLLIIGLIAGFTLGSHTNISTTTITIAGETGTLTAYETVEKVVTVIRPTTIISLSERTITDTVTITVTKTIYVTGEGAGDSCAVFKTSKDVYGVSEKVTLILENNCDYTLTLPNSAPWMIFDSEGRIVFSPIALQVIIHVGPGTERRWTWDQRDNEGIQVPAGKYYARLKTLNAGILTTEFEIAESQHSGCACS